jgi:hypothetical protein
MTELKSNKAKYVREQAPISCHIQFICKGHRIFTRFGTQFLLITLFHATVTLYIRNPKSLIMDL